MGKEKQGLRCDTTVWEDGRKIEEKNGLCRGDCHLQTHRQESKVEASQVIPQRTPRSFGRVTDPPHSEQPGNHPPQRLRHGFILQKKMDSKRLEASGVMEDCLRHQAGNRGLRRKSGHSQWDLQPFSKSTA